MYAIRSYYVDQIIRQLDVLSTKYHPSVIKIGLIESQASLSLVLDFINLKWPDAFVIWDPILKASSGFDFHGDDALDVGLLVKDRIQLLTPNIPEFTTMFKETLPSDVATELNCAVLITGGHTHNSAVCDKLYTPKQPELLIISKKVEGDWQKHGTGCVLSAAICANLALGESLKNARNNFV